VSHSPSSDRGEVRVRADALPAVANTRTAHRVLCKATPPIRETRGKNGPCPNIRSIKIGNSAGSRAMVHRCGQSRETAVSVNGISGRAILRRVLIKIYHGGYGLRG